MRNFVRSSILSVALLSSACGDARTSDEEVPLGSQSTIQQPGFQNIKIGASLDETLGLVGDTYYGAEDIVGCQMSMPSDGCILVWNNWAVPYVKLNGVPYRLNLTFDRWDKLTDLTLVFSRRENDLSAGQCAEVYERTLSWLTTEYGTFDELAGAPLEAPDFLKSLRAPPIPTDSGEPMDIFLISSFLAGSCDVNATFSSGLEAADQ